MIIGWIEVNYLAKTKAGGKKCCPIFSLFIFVKICKRKVTNEKLQWIVLMEILAKILNWDHFTWHATWCLSNNFVSGNWIRQLLFSLRPWSVFVWVIVCIVFCLVVCFVVLFLGAYGVWVSEWKATCGDK